MIKVKIEKKKKWNGKENERRKEGRNDGIPGDPSFSGCSAKQCDAVGFFCLLRIRVSSYFFCVLSMFFVFVFYCVWLKLGLLPFILFLFIMFYLFFTFFIIIFCFIIVLPFPFLLFFRFIIVLPFPFYLFSLFFIFFIFLFSFVF